LTVILKHFVIVLELKHNGMSSIKIKNDKICSLQMQTFYSVKLRDPCLRIIKDLYWTKCGPVSSVGIATDYGLDDLGSNPGRDEIFRPSRPALGPTHPPAKWVPALSRG